MRVSTFVVAAVAALAASAVAWGPATHYYTTCRAFAPTESECALNRGGKHGALLSGTEMPDAFFFGAYVVGGDCSGLVPLHSLVFAGYLLQTALNRTSVSAAERKAGVELAKGFGAHVAMDAAGFFPGGYLKKSSNWIATWPLMTAVDAYVVQQKLNATAAVVPRNVPNLTAYQSELISAAASKFNVTVSAAQVWKCAAQWQLVVAEETVKAAELPAPSYAWEMTRSLEGAADGKTFAKAVARVDAAVACAVPSIALWVAAIEAGKTPQAAFAELITYYSHGFSAGGACLPAA
jgi:hypothetical protein